MSRRSRDRNPPGERTFFAQLARDPSALLCHLGAHRRVEHVLWMRVVLVFVTAALPVPERPRPQGPVYPPPAHASDDPVQFHAGRQEVCACRLIVSELFVCASLAFLVTASRA